MPKLVAVMVDDELTIHAPGATSDYHTLCGLDADDLDIGLQQAKTPRGAKVTCEQCANIWKTAKSLRASSFEPRLLNEE